MTIGPVDLEDLDPCIYEVPGKTCAIGAGALHAHPGDRAKGLEPRDKRSMALCGRVEALGVENLAHFTRSLPDMDILWGCPCRR